MDDNGNIFLDDIFIKLEESKRFLQTLLMIFIKLNFIPMI